MGSFHDFIQLITKIQWTDVLDILLVAFLIYKLIPLLRSTGTMRIAWVVIVVFVMTWLTDVLNMHTTNFLINQLLQVGLIAVVVLFQPELRRMLDHLANVKLKKFFVANEKGTEDLGSVISQTVMACEAMSRERVGALIVFGRDSSLADYTKTGTPIDAQVSEQLIRNIVFPKAALHDGAMIVLDGRVAAAGCVLPLSHSNRLSADLGTRHRAGVGMSEISDAVVVIVSEETGAISVAVGGMLKRHLAPQTLGRLLRNELHVETQDKEDNLVLMLRQKLKKGKEDGRNEK